MDTNPIEQRRAFVDDHESGQWSMTELCERYGITRPTGYLWARRYREAGLAGLAERSRVPGACPHRTAPEVEERILELRERRGWGAKKLLQALARGHPEIPWPARSTVNAILERHGKLRRQRRRRRFEHPGAVPLRTDAPNQVWPADFKGQFKTRDGRYCYPLTVTDHYSRALLACRGLPSVKGRAVKPVFLRLFREIGLPEAIRTDNGPPFSSVAIHGVCQLSVWWMKLAIVHQRIRPASPQENGQHERMHRELKRETTRPSGAATTRSAPTTESAATYPRPAGRPRPAPTLSACGRPSTRGTWRCGASARSAPSGSRIASASSARLSWAKTSASRSWATGAGTSSSTAPC